MFKWPTFLQRKSTSSDSEHDQDKSNKTHIVETAVSPPRRWTVGRRLAFTINNSVIQMVATRHLAGRCDILDISIIAMLHETESVARQNDHLSLTIADYVSQFGKGNAEIDLIISGRETAFRSFLMPVLNSNTLESAISFEAQKQIPFPPAECITDYQRTFKIIDNKRSRYKIALHAATSRLVKEQLEPFRQKGLEVTSVVIADEALGYLLGCLPDYDSNTIYTLFEAGPQDCKVAYFRGSALEFTHTGSTGMSKLGDNPDITRIDYFSESLANEISVSQDYYSNQYAKALPNKIFVSGELANQPELLELFNSKTQYEFVPFPLGKTGLFKKNIADQKKLAYSCLPTLAAATTSYQLCNLLPRKIREAKTCRQIGRYSRLAISLMALILLTSWAHMRMSIDNSYSSVDVVERQVALASQSEAYNKHRSLIQQIAFNRAYIKMTKMPSGSFHYSLKELSILTPSEIKLYRLEYAPELLEDFKNLILHGNVEALNIPPEMILAQYIERLKKSGIYHNVELVRHVKRKVKDTFVIEFQIEMQGVV